MRPRLATPLLLLALAMPLGACGQSEKDKYIDDFKPLNDKLLDIGGELGAAVGGADNQDDAALAKQFGALARRLDAVNKDIADLDTPSDLQDEAKALNGRIDDTVGELEAIEKAARGHNAEDAAAATVQLATDSEAVNKAQNKLARATGARVGEQ
jgi:predicted  nucleic acid-binding Zn-ribbon protein